ncbi:hypothetical protein AB0O16_07565 [Microbacterium sp. NPDC089180]|uniref:hypothetical protein n=1 Tax=unclassified Microbacterium TaxID=2609290 RepID=UPI00343D58DD
MVLGLIVLAGLPLLLMFELLDRVPEVISWIGDRIEQRRDAKRVRIEAELDRTQAELRATILQLAADLGGDAHEARKAMIRESYLHRGEVSQ